MKKHLLIIGFILLSLLQTHAYENFNFHVLDVKAGITDNYIQDILHDDYGFMWFATRTGLNRYDGYYFKLYTITQLGAYDNNIEWVSQDASGTIWIKNPVLYCYYDPERDELSNQIEKKLGPLGINNKIDQIFIDEDKSLWCVANSTLYCYHFDAEKLFSLTLPRDMEVVDLACRNSRAYLLLSDGTVASVNWVLNEIQHEMHVEDLIGFQPRLYIDSRYCLWFYSTHGSRVSCYSTVERQWVDFPGKNELNTEHNNITAVTDDGKGNIWIGTDNNGIYICHLNEKMFTNLYKESKQLFTLPSNHITCFFKDNMQIMWVGTSKQGVAYSCLNEVIFENIICSRQEDVSCLLEDRMGNLWLGFDGEGIACIRQDGTQDRYYKSKDSSLPSNLIVSSYLDSKGRIWWGSFGDGPFYFENGKFTIPAYDSHNGVARPNYIRRIAEDEMGNIWFATYTQGLYCLDTTNTLTAYTMANSKIVTNYIADLSCKDGRNLYIATSSGFYHMDIVTRHIRTIDSDKDGIPIVADHFVNCVYQDSHGILWIGSRNGISIYNPTGNKVHHLTPENGLSHAYIRAIAEDANKNIWVSTDHGITHVLREVKSNTNEITYRCYPYFEKDGIGDFTFNNFSITSNSNNEIMIGGLGGYVKIRPIFADFQTDSKQVAFTGFYLANQRIEATKPLTDGRVLLRKNIALTSEIKLKHSDRNFSLDVSAMDFGSLHKLRYEYRLNSKEEWVRLDGNRINFNALPPGTYQLEVKVSEKVGSVEMQPASLLLHISPPFWQSPFAYIFYFLFFVSSAVFYIYMLRRKHKHLLQQQTRELEIAKLREMDDAKMRFFTNVSHDLRTPLSMIITPLERMIHEQGQSQPNNDLLLMHRNAHILLDEVNQLLDFRKLDKKETNLYASYGNLSEFVKDICKSFSTICINSHLKLDVQINSTTLEMNFDRNKMQRILLNLLSNAVKYNTEFGSVTVIVDKILNEQGEQARIQVADTGIGVREENKTKIFNRFFQEHHVATTYVGNGIGLHIVQEYVALHGGCVEVIDNHPKGSIFVLTIPMQSVVDEVSLTLSVETPTQSEMEGQCEADSLTGHPKLLIVEDNTDFRNFLTSALKDDYDVYNAENGKMALNMLGLHNIEMVISDVMMPVMDGLQLCQKIKTDIRYSHIPVILLTARTAQEHVLNGLREGADEYITKPFNLEVLKLRINKLIYWTQNNHERFKTVEVSPSEITVSTLDEKLIEKAIQTVEQNIDNTEFSVEDLSASVGMSRGHLYKKLISITGKSPLEFIRVLRIKRGHQLLSQSQLSVSQISYQVGLSPKQFSKYYKEEFGCLPSEFKSSDKTRPS